MKLSDLKVGDILNVKASFKPIIIVLSNSIYVESSAEGEDKGQIKYLSIRGFKLFKDIPKRKLQFDLNRITPEEVLNDNYDVEIKKMDIKELPLYINEPKTDWFQKALNKEIHEHGTNIYPHLMSILKNGIPACGVKPLVSTYRSYEGRGFRSY